MCQIESAIIQFDSFEVSSLASECMAGLSPKLSGTIGDMSALSNPAKNLDSDSELTKLNQHLRLT